MPPQQEEKKEPQHERQEEKRSVEDRIRELESRLAQAQAQLPLTTTPEHGAGPGMEVRDTWSLWEQEQARDRLPR